MATESLETSESDIEAAEPLTIRKKDSQCGKYKCSFTGCALRFKRQVYLDRHEYTHTGVRKYTCTYESCTKSYTNTTHLKRHIKVSHENLQPEKNVKCLVDSCNKSFDSVYIMERHMKDVHENPKIYPCPNCSKEFRRKIQLRRHVITHTGEYPFKCTNCSKGFVLQRLYDRHSCNPKTYKCETCEKEFSKWTVLVAHRRTDHMTIHKCEQCQKVFKRKEYLKAHLENHKDIEDREVLQCPWENCDKFYYHTRNLKNHIRTKHEGLKLKCPHTDCDKEFASRQKLQYHMRLHEIGPKLLKTEKQKAKRKRSDIGKKKKSFASTLSGVILESKAEKLVLEGKGNEIDVVAPDASEVTDTDDDRPISKKVELLGEPM